MIGPDEITEYLRRLSENKRARNMTKELTNEDVEKINDALAPLGWSVGRIYRARDIEINDLQKKLDTARFNAEARAREAGNYCPGFGYISEDPEFKKAYKEYYDLFNEP